MKPIYCIVFFICTSLMSYGQTDTLVLPKIDSTTKVNITFKKEQKYRVELTNGYKIIGLIKESNPKYIVIVSKITGSHKILLNQIAAVQEYNEMFIPKLALIEKDKEKSIKTNDGKLYKGIIEKKDSTIIINGVQSQDTIQIEDIESVSIKYLSPTVPAIIYNRLMVGKTAIPMKAGSYFYRTNALVDHELIYGVEDWFNIGAGANFAFDQEGLGIGLYVSGNVGFELRPLVHLGGTVEYAYHPRKTSLFVDKSSALAYSTLTIGKKKQTLSFSYGFTQRHLQISKKPIWSVASSFAYKRIQVILAYWKLDPYIDEDSNSPITKQADFLGFLVRYSQGRNIYEFGFGRQNAYTLNSGGILFPRFAKFPASLAFYHQINKTKKRNHKH